MVSYETALVPRDEGCTLQRKALLVNLTQYRKNRFTIYILSRAVAQFPPRNNRAPMFIHEPYDDACLVSLKMIVEERLMDPT
jgi:hypothetical protein